MLKDHIDSHPYAIEIYYGNRINQVTVPAVASTYHEKHLQLQELMSNPSYPAVATTILVDQVHGTGIKTIYTNSDLNGYHPRTWTADALITTLPTIALGIMTADCLPIVIAAPDIPVVALIHAGWRGLVQNIIPQVIESLMSSCHIDPKQISVTIGPAIHSCCYRVSEDFLEQIPSALHGTIIQKRGIDWHCDLIGYSIHQIRTYGLRASSIHIDSTVCTACSVDYYSYRRDREKAKRNITLAWIRTLD